MITPNVSPICALVRQNNEAPLTESRYDFGYMTLFIGSHVKVILPRWDIRAGHIANLDESSCKLAKILELLFVKD